VVKEKLEKLDAHEWLSHEAERASGSDPLSALDVDPADVCFVVMSYCSPRLRKDLCAKQLAESIDAALGNGGDPPRWDYVCLCSRTGLRTWQGTF